METTSFFIQEIRSCSGKYMRFVQKKKIPLNQCSRVDRIEWDFFSSLTQLLAPISICYFLSLYSLLAAYTVFNFLDTRAFNFNWTSFNVLKEQEDSEWSIYSLDVLCHYTHIRACKLYPFENIQLERPIKTLSSLATCMQLNEINSSFFNIIIIQPINYEISFFWRN